MWSKMVISSKTFTTRWSLMNAGNVLSNTRVQRTKIGWSQTRTSKISNLGPRKFSQSVAGSGATELAVSLSDTKIKERELTDFLDASLAINHIFFVVFKSTIFCFFDTTTVWYGISCCCIFFLKWVIYMSHEYESWFWVIDEGWVTYLCIFDEFLWILPIFVIFNTTTFEFSLNHIPRWGDWSFWSFPFLIGWLLGLVWVESWSIGSG